MLEAMFRDSETHVGNERALTNDAMHELDLTGQLLLPRPMLVARVGRPGRGSSWITRRRRPR